MTDDERLADLLLRWEELHEQGREASAEEICEGCPELVGPLARHIAALKALHWMKAGDVPPSSGLDAPTGEDAPTRTLAGRYRLDKLVGEGGFGQVWKGYDLELERHVAVKVPKPSRRFSTDEIERFVAEARKLAKLRHPGIVAVHDICRSGAAFFFVSDWIEGSDLALRLRQGPVTHDQAVRTVAEVARILAYAHGQGVIHRDIKPANILLDAGDNPLVTDFGIAATEEELLHEPRRLVATLAYASPEQVSGQSIDARTDLWSLGVVLFQMLAGRLPFDDPNPVALREKIVSHEPPPLSSLDATISTDLERICLKCLAKKSAARYATAQELVEALAAFQNQPRRSKGRLVALAVGVALLVGVLLATAYWPRTPRTPDQRTAQPEDDTLPATEAVRSFEGHKGPVLCVAFSPDGKTVASGGADATVRLWPVEGDDQGVVLPQITGCTALAYTKDGKTLACGCENGTVRLWDLAGAKPKEGLVLPGHSGPITCVAFSPDGKFLVTGGKDGIVRLLNRTAAKPSAATIPKAGGVVLWTSFSSGGDKLLLGYGDGPDTPSEFLVWDLTTKDGSTQLAMRQRAPLVGLKGVKALLISSDGNLILAATATEVDVWIKEAGKDSFRVVGALPRPAACLALSPDQRSALSCGKDGLRLWAVNEMNETARLVGHEGAVNGVAFSPTGALAASGGADGTVRLWRSGEKKAVMKTPPLRISNLDRTQTTDEGLRQFEGMADLGELRLTETKVTDARLAALAGLPDLQVVGLGGTKVSEDGLKRLKKLPR